MNESQLPAHGEPASPEVAAFQQFLEGWLAQAAPSLAEGARYAALPHSFDLALLSGLRGTVEGTAALVEQLERAGLVVTEGAGRYAFQPLLRNLLLHRWQTEDRTAYRRASARAAEFYRARLPGGEADQIEYVYHQLGADDALGIAALLAAFERAWAVRHLGLAERLLRYADEQAPVLGPDAQAWLRYFQARLDSAYYRHSAAEAALRLFVGEGTEPRLRARALVSLADILVYTQRWADASGRYAEAAALFRELGDRFSAARALEAQGMAYVHLATSLGGLPAAGEIGESRYQAWWRRFRDAPFLVYRWFSRRVAYLPNLYFGTDYQDWIIIRLLYEAIHRFEQAAQQLAGLPPGTDLPVDDLSTDIQIRLADLYHRVGQWARAERRFERLARAPAVEANEYRRATLRLGQGRAALSRSTLNTAREHLQAARQVFIRYGDRRALAAAACLLGDAEVAAHYPDAAVPFYTESGEASLATDDLLTATHVWSTLMTVRERFPLTPAAQAQLDAWGQTLDRRAYVARFPGVLLERFRRLAVYVALPLTYLMILAVTLALTILAGILEKASLVGLTSNVLIFLAIQPLPLWLYDFLYVFAGWLFVRLLPLGDVTQLQPRYVVTVPDGIAVRGEDGRLRDLRWDAVERYVTMDRCLWRQPIALFSRLAPVAERTLVLDGIVSHYQRLQDDIIHRLERTGRPIVRTILDFSFFNSRWTLIALALTILMGTIGLLGWLDPEHEPAIVSVQVGDEWYNLPATSILFQYYSWALQFFPLIGLGRLLYNRAAVRRILGSRIALGSGWPIWLAFVFLLLRTLLSIWGLAA